LCEQISPRVEIATNCDAVSSHNRQDLIQSLVPTSLQNALSPQWCGVSNKYQFYSLCFDTIGAQTHDLQHSIARWAR